MSLPSQDEDTPGSGGDYAAIEAAVMETARGRWFLAEYARRNRVADTNLLLAEIRRLEARLIDRPAPPAPDPKTSPRALAEVLAEARRDTGRRPFTSFVEDGRAELSRIEGAAERLHELAGDLREGKAEGEIAGDLKAQADIVTTASRLQTTALGKLASIAHALDEMERRLGPGSHKAPDPASATPPQRANPRPAVSRIDFRQLRYEQTMALFS